MAQNIYDNQDFFEAYLTFKRLREGVPTNCPLEWHSIVKMLPELDKMNVLDLGCGYGWFCRYAHEKGAAQVLGLDISTKMLDQAREMTKDSAIIYKQQDLEKLELAEETYDLVHSSFAIHYIENLSSLFETIYRGLKPGAYFVFATEHPIYSAPKRAGWIIDKNNGQKSWPINSYQEEGKRVIHWFVDGVIKQHRLISTYLNMLIETGFVIKHIEEFAPSEEQILNNPSLEEEKERPIVFLASVQKPLKKSL